jgi:glycosyltransferase involved in cell wall biosynthesis
MKILIIKCYPGEINIIHNTYNQQQIGLAAALTKAGHACGVMCPADALPKETVIQTEGGGIRFYAVKAVNILKNTIFIGADNIFAEYDVIQSGEYNQLFNAYLAKKYPEKTIIWHGTYYSAFNRRYNLMCKTLDPFIIPLYKRLDTPFITKSGLAADFLKAKGITNVSAVGVGLDIEPLLCHAQGVHPFAQELYKKSPDEKYLLYIGRIEKRRCTDFLVDVFRKVNSEMPLCKLVIIGSGDKDYVQSCFKKIEDYGLADKVHYTERLEQKFLGEIYKLCDLFILPTRYEIFGMVILEAMYFGVPVITTVNGGSVTLIDDGEDGLICDNFDAEVWSDKIKALLTNDAKRQSMGKAAAKKIADGFTWDALVGKFIDIYNDRLLTDGGR